MNIHQSEVIPPPDFDTLKNFLNTMPSTLKWKDTINQKLENNNV